MDRKKILISSIISFLTIGLIILLIPAKIKNETGFMLTYIYYILYNIAILATLYKNTNYILKEDILNTSVIYLYVKIDIVTIIFLVISKFVYINTNIILIIILLLGLYSFLLFYNVVNGNRYINNHTKKMEKSTKVVKEWITKLEVLINNNENSKIKSNLNNLYELVKYMDPVENENTFALDNEINNLFKKLEKEINDDVIKEIMTKIKERKVIISDNK